MSTSDAGELELGVVGGETATPLCTAETQTQTAREQEDESSAICFEQVPFCVSGASHSVIRPDGTHTAVTASPRKDNSGVRIENPVRPEFTSCISLKLTSRPGLGKPDLNLHKEPDPWTQRLHGQPRVSSEHVIYRVHGQTSTVAKKVALPVRNDKGTQYCNNIRTCSEPGDIQSLSKGHCGLFRKYEVDISQRGLLPKRTGSGLVALEADQTKRTNLNRLKERSGHSTMLSSTVVTVLAPQWGGRLRRNKKEGNSDFQGNFQDGTQGVERMLTGGYQQHGPFVSSRSNTGGWSSKSGPTSLGYESQRKVPHSVSLDVNSLRNNDKKTDVHMSSPRSPLSPLSPLSPMSPRSPMSPVSPMSVDSNEPQRSPQRGLSASSSKPTTSSMLLSLRRGNNNSRSPNEIQTLGSPDSLQNNQQFPTHHSQAFQLKNELSPTSVSNRPNSNEPLSLAPSFRERDRTKTYTFSTSPNKHTDPPFSQANASRPELLNPQRSYSREPSDSIKLTKKPVPLPKRTPYDHTALLKTQSAPRRTPLSSTLCCPQDNQDSSSQKTSNEITSYTPITPPFNNNNSLTDNRGFNCQIPNYRDNNNTAESVCKGNMNLVVKRQGGTYNTEDSPNHQSPVKGRPDSCLNREPPKPQSLPGVFSNSKFSRAPPYTALSHAKGLTECANNGSFTAKVTEFPPTSSSPKSVHTPTDSSSKYQNMYCASKTNNTSSVLQNKDLQKFTKQSHLLDITNTVTNAAPNNNKPGLDLAQNHKNSIQSSPVSSQASIQVSTHASAPTQTLSPKFTDSTPLGFERSYVSVPKPSQAKTISNLNPTVGLYSKTNHSPTLTTNSSSPSLLSPHSPPVSVTVSCLLTPPPTPSFSSPNSTETSPNKTFTNSQEADSKKQRPREETKRVRRVTFEDSVDSNTEEKPEPSNPPSPRNVRAPLIFSFLRSSNPTPNGSPRFSPTPKSSGIQVGAGGKYRSFSSDSADLKSRETYKQTPTDALTFDRKKQDLNPPRQERTVSVESAGVQCRSAAPLSLPPDYSHGYKHRYSSPPYSTLVSSRSAQAETNTKPPHSPLFQHPSQPNVSMHISPIVDMNSAISKRPLLLSSTVPLRALPPQTASQESLNCKNIHSDQVNINPINSNSEVFTNGQILLVDNRVHISSQSLPGDKSHRSSSTCVTETLVYSIRAKTETAEDGPRNTTPKPVQHTANTPVSQLNQQWPVQRKEPLREQDNQSNQSSSGSSSTESQTNEEENCKRKIKEVGNSKFYSIESHNEQSPKRSRFALKKSSSTSSSSLSRSESERANKTNNKMDQVFSKLRQTFRRSSDDDVSLPRKWKKTSQAPSVSGMSDASNSSDVTVESNRTLEEPEEEATMELNNIEKGTEDKHKWTNKRCTLVSPSTEINKMAEDKFSIWTDEVMTDSENYEPAAVNENVRIHNPTQQFDFKNETLDFKPTNQVPSPKDISPRLSPNASSAFPSTQFRKSTSSPRSPFSPFSALSPFSSPDTLEDSVFYSPKPQRHRDSSSSPCELGEISLVASRRSRASTGPPSSGPGPNKERMSTSYADLKYGIEPGKSFSVSSVLSSRPSGPGRISTGTRFMSVGDLSKSAFSCGHTVNHSDNWSTQYGCQPPCNSQAEYFPSDSGKARSRSLPRSLTRCLTNWGSIPSPSPSGPSTTSNPTWRTNINNLWDRGEGPPTPPPTPPLSPVSRRMSKPPSLSLPTFTGSPEPPQDSHSPRGHLPSRQYTSSLSTFEESSDSSSDTTTDDEYYLETGEEKEKETEL